MVKNSRAECSSPWHISWKIFLFRNEIDITGDSFGTFSIIFKETIHEESITNFPLPSKKENTQQQKRRCNRIS